MAQFFTSTPEIVTVRPSGPREYRARTQLGNVASAPTHVICDGPPVLEDGLSTFRVIFPGEFKLLSDHRLFVLWVNVGFFGLSYIRNLV